MPIFYPYATLHISKILLPLCMINSARTYLVTGGAGFIGANFVKYLVGTYGQQVRIVVLDALTYAGNQDLSKHLTVW